MPPHHPVFHVDYGKPLGFPYDVGEALHFQDGVGTVGVTFASMDSWRSAYMDVFTACLRGGAGIIHGMNSPADFYFNRW